uniref:Mediator of RNA polymerase II transcription subunit 15 n=1 Tax=Rhipicephalus microplus TaxID=6941 RepID=A0A6M2D9P7_RHIMP
MRLCLALICLCLIFFSLPFSEEAIRQAANPPFRSATEMENHVFQKARSKDEYLSYVARLIIHVREMSAKRDKASANPADSTGDDDALEASSMEPNTVEQMESAEPTSSALAETALAGQKTARASELEEEVKARREAIEEERKLRREEHFFRMRMMRAEAKERKAINDQKLKNAQAKARLLKLKVELLKKQQQ